jgi:acyl carrier protein
MSLTKEQLLAYFEDSFNVDISNVETETLLFSSGLIDSFSMIDLIVYIEESCDIRIKPPEIILDNIDSISRILAFLEKKGVN